MKRQTSAPRVVPLTLSSSPRLPVSQSPRLPVSVSALRRDVAAARLDGELALRLLDRGRDFQTELAHGAVPFFVRRGEAHAVARAQVLDEFGERCVEVFRLVVQDFAAGLVGEVVDT